MTNETIMKNEKLVPGDMDSILVECIMKDIELDRDDVIDNNTVKTDNPRTRILLSRLFGFKALN